MKKIKRALISLSDKKNLIPLLKVLKKHKISIISSGGTYNHIIKLGFKCIKISEFTKSNEILDGRVKTLHPKIYGGILHNRRKKTHLKDLKENNYEEIDLVIVNFYPFEKKIEEKKNHKLIIENIDIGGPTLVRSSAKNYEFVTTITDPKQYNSLIFELNKNDGTTSMEFRKKMAEEAFSETAYYDSSITKYFNDLTKNKFPEKKIIHSKLIEKL